MQIKKIKLPIVDSTGSPCYALIILLREILSPLAGKSESFVKNLGHFVQLLKSVNFQSLGTIVSFDVVSFLRTYQSTEPYKSSEIRKLQNYNTWAEPSVLQVEAIIELLEVCLRTTYFSGGL
jgi:hypothetical protein